MLTICFFLFLQVNLSHGLPAYEGTGLLTTADIVTSYTTVENTLTVTTLVPFSTSSSGSPWTNAISQPNIKTIKSETSARNTMSLWTDQASNTASVAATMFSWTNKTSVPTQITPTAITSMQSSTSSCVHNVSGSKIRNSIASNSIFFPTSTVSTSDSTESLSQICSATTLIFATTTSSDLWSHTWSDASSTTVFLTSSKSSSRTWIDSASISVTESSSPLSYTWSDTTAIAPHTAASTALTSLTNVLTSTTLATIASTTTSMELITTSSVSSSDSITPTRMTSTTSISRASPSMLSTVTCHQPRPTGAPSPAGLLIAMTGYGKIPNPWIGWACKQFSTSLFGNSTTAGVFGIDKERIIYGQGSHMYVLTLTQSKTEARFCHPAIADILQECIISSSNYGGVWWSDNEMYNLTNLNFPGSPIVGSANPSCTHSSDHTCATGTYSTSSRTAFMSGTTALGLTATPSLPMVTLTVTGTRTGSVRPWKSIIRNHHTMVW